MASITAAGGQRSDSQRRVTTLGEPVRVSVSPSTVFRVHLTIIALVVLAGTAVTLIASVWGWERGFGGLRRLFDLNGEQNVPATVSSLALLLASLLLACIAVQERALRSPRRRYWLILCLGFAYLAVDEAASLHEFFNPVMRMLLGTRGWATAWTALGIVAVLVVGLLFFRFLFAIRRRTASEFILAGGVFLTGAIVVETVSGIVQNSRTQASLLFHGTVILEETLEMLGVALFIRALLREMQARRLNLRLTFG